MTGLAVAAAAARHAAQATALAAELGVPRGDEAHDGLRLVTGAVTVAAPARRWRVPSACVAVRDPTCSTPRPGSAATASNWPGSVAG